MFEVLVDNYVLPLFISILAGIFILPISKLLISSKIIKSSNPDYPKYSGVWYGIHLSKIDRTDKQVISKHKYDIKVLDSGNIKGLFFDYLAEAEPWEYDISGQVIPGGIILNSVNKLRSDLFSIQIFFNPLSPIKLKGILVSYDYQNNPFFSPIVLSRKDISTEEYEKELEFFKSEYYNAVEDYTNYNLIDT